MNPLTRNTAMVAVAALVLSGCSQYAGEKETAGTLFGAATGAALGAAIGSKTNCHGHHCRSKTSGNAIVIGALAGGIVGNAVGRSMDEKDRRAHTQTYSNALEYNRSGQPSYWHNPDSGNSGAVTPSQAYERRPGEYCREYQQTITVGGRQQEGYGTACRRADGSWEIVNG